MACTITKRVFRGFLRLTLGPTNYEQSLLNNLHWSGRWDDEGQDGSTESLQKQDCATTRACNPTPKDMVIKAGAPPIAELK